MKNHYKKLTAKYKREGLLPTLKKIVTFSTAYTVRYLSYNRSNQKKWDALKDKYKGKRVFFNWEWTKFKRNTIVFIER